MRIDKFLKNSRLIKRRTVAKEACEGGRILVNGRAVKPGYEVRCGDEITVRFGDREVTLRATNLIENPKKDEAVDMYELI
jgi:ribosomal 50S subunit-recycling heat shock protein